MPINVFSRQAMGNRVNQGLGFNMQNLLQQHIASAQQGADESAEMSRRKWAADMLSQQLQQAQENLLNQKAMLENEQSRYRFGQEQEYYGGLHTPAGQAAMRAYSERLGIPLVDDVTTPQGVQTHAAFGQMITGREEGQKQIAARILEAYGPALLQAGGKQLPPEVIWARSVLGEGGQEASPEVQAPVEQPEETTGVPRGALSTFIHSAAPPLVGIGTGAYAGSKVPGPWPVKLGAGVAGYLAGERLANMVGGPSAEDIEAHPTASNLGTAAGLAAGLFTPSGYKQVFGGGSPVAGLKGYLQKNLPPKPPGGGTPQTGAILSKMAGAPKGASPASPVQKKLAVPPGKRGRSMPAAKASTIQKIPPPGKRGRSLPTHPKASSLSKVTPPGQRGRQLPKQSLGMAGVPPPSNRGYGVNNPTYMAAIAQFFNLNGRLPNPQELAQLLALP